MIAAESFRGQRVAVFGLGGSGLAAAKALVAGGAEVLCADDNTERVTAAAAAGLATGDLAAADFAGFDALLLAPGVPLTHPEPHWTAARANAAGIPIIGDIEVFDRERRARLSGMRLVAITGTNGKSTTTALLTHLLTAMGETVEMAGNIGRPALDLDPQTRIAVLEASSFQIDLSPTIAPDIGVLLNVTYDHVDRHGTFEAYRAIKERLVEQSAVAVLGHASSDVNRFARRLAGEPGHTAFGFAASRFTASAEAPRCAGFSSREVFGDVAYAGGAIAHSRLEPRRSEAAAELRNVHAGWDLAAFRATADADRALGAIPDVPSLRGDHNAQNVAAALAIILALGLDPAEAVPHLATYPGLPHRMEEVGRAGEVIFVNDSKATNADSAITALKAFDHIYWIAGGKAKSDGLTTLRPERYDIRHAYLIGDAAQRFEGELDGKVPVTQCGTLDAALDAAASDAAGAGRGTVLLSPACASYDQFRSFEERGDIFRTLVQKRLEAANG